MVSKPIPEQEFQTTIRLVAAAQGGNSTAFEDLFRRYLPRVRRIVALRMGTRLRQFFDMEDIVQESLLKVFQSIGRFDHQTEGSFRHWMARCVECEVIDSARRMEAQKRGANKVRRFGDCGSEMTMIHVPVSRGPTPSGVVQARELEERLDEALLGMPERQRELIILRRLCEMSYEEIAKAMDFPTESAARRAVGRALNELERLIQE